MYLLKETNYYISQLPVVPYLFRIEFELSTAKGSVSICNRISVVLVQ